MKVFWISWFVVFLVAEAYAVVTGKPTLSNTWLWLIQALPVYVSILVSMATSAALLWLIGPHWVLRAYDSPGFDWAERAVVIIGALLGILGGYQSTRKGKDDKGNQA